MAPDLRVFFAIYPLHPINPSPAPASLPTTMGAFKTFLESDGASLATTPEFLAYYAMSYVPEVVLKLEHNVKYAGCSRGL